MEIMVGRRTPKSPPCQPFASSARISNCVHLSDLRFMVFIFMVLQLYISAVWYSGKITELFNF